MTFSLIPLFLLALLPYSSCVGVRQRRQLHEQIKVEPSPDLPVPRVLGIKRRLERASASDGSEAVGESVLRHQFRKDWAVGELSSVQVQRYSSGAQRSCVSASIDIQEVASAATDGKHKGNLFRDLRKQFGWPDGCPEFDWIEVPMLKNSKTPVPVISPHRFLPMYKENYPQRFNSRIAGTEAERREFWDSISHTRFAREHPRLRPDRLHNTIALGFHADAGAYNKQDSIFVISWNGLLGKGNTGITRFLYTAVRKSEMTTDTLDRILEHMAASFNILSSEDFWDSYGFIGVLCQVRGDWQFYTECFRFPQWNALSMCWCCAASSTVEALLWTNTRKDAGWRDTTWTHEQFIRYLHMIGMAIPVLFLVLGLRLENIMVDPLHTVDLGLTAHIVGNIIWLYVFRKNIFGLPNHGQRLKALNEHLWSWYNSSRCPYRLQAKLTLDRIRTSKQWPKLKGKAAATRSLVPYCIFLLDTFGDFGNREERLARAVVRLIAEFYELMKAEDRILSAHARERLPHIGQKLAELYGKLSVMSLRANLKFWKQVPKFHMWEHLTEEQILEFGNPKFWWTYADEDLVGRVIKIAETVHTKTLTASVLFKWAHSFFADDYD